MPDYRSIVGACKSKPKNVLFADPRDPANVYAAYTKAIRMAKKERRSCGAVYETLSDFVKVADYELVVNYLRRSIVYEEVMGIRSLYLLWFGVTPKDMDDNYLRWFFNAVFKISKEADGVYKDKYRVVVENLFQQNVQMFVSNILDEDILDMFKINNERIELLAKALNRLDYNPPSYGFFQHVQHERECRIAGYLLYMVAVDYNTHTSANNYEGIIQNAFYHGSDLLFKKAEIAALKDHKLFYDHEYMSKISNQYVQKIFQINGRLLPSDTNGRAEIFRDIGKQLDKMGIGILELLKKCNNCISGDDGLINKLSVFQAYSDPFQKKSNLFCKTLIREGIINPIDRDMLEIPVDHVVMTIALRSGIVECNREEIVRDIHKGFEVDDFTLSILRDVTKDAYKLVASIANTFVDVVDDLVWSYGRKSLREKAPLTNPEKINSELDSMVNKNNLCDFVKILNGIDDKSDSHWREYQIIHYPFTRFF
ncbi:hypothetical protein Clim_0228 [Chlorobium limicola DSM 245]|uniref:Uncharacterized protein n=1 Tax=Chlorobium limicola (strain DSM 245 / NBRC 103803 / 6330) TaxID=290315 RepID=B3EEU2_CHLL2|nr:hypothetical protein [Chlorobium limicola]ACD89325.1 hypothetical protein Clim_0228 [Chlorobium limicola DSM 245]